MSAGIARFAADAWQNPAEVAAHLASRPAPTSQGGSPRVGIPRPEGAVHVLHVPTVRDRAVERSMLTILIPVTDRDG